MRPPVVRACRTNAECASNATWPRRRLVDAVKTAALAKGVRNPSTIVMKSNQVAEAIVASARSQQCDLIVMASHGRRSFARMLMGSETFMSRLTHTYPVLVAEIGSGEPQSGDPLVTIDSQSHRPK